MTTIHPLSYESLKLLLTPRLRDSHKGDYGHVLVIGGDHGMGGAVLMAGAASARSGAGLTSIATRAEHIPALMAQRPELMARGIATDADLAALLERATVLVIGPGLGQSAWSQECLRQALEAAAARALPVVLDADALNWLSQDASLYLQGLQGKCLLTPHAGEAARLLGITREAVNADRPAAVLALQKKFGGAAVLKGAGTLICYPQGERVQVAACGHGNPGMASGGMGDVLSGVLGALLAQGFALADSVRLGVCIHSKAADLAAASAGERGLLATDLLPHIRQLLNP
jgi:ADP-dependent NAD(P)H-hydrate dehydratase / NAD(P)H-hydrate epimerase